MSYAVERNEEESENDLLEILKNNIIKNRFILQKPDCIFYVSWTPTNSEGRITRVWNNIGEVDKVKERIIKIWTFIFPEMREDYLVEKIWKWMNKREEREEKKSYKLLIHFCDKCEIKSTESQIHINSDFLKRLNGVQLKKDIEKEYTKIYHPDYQKDKNLLFLKAARILKYDLIFNTKQIEGIDKGFSWWVRPAKGREKEADSLSIFFKQLNGVADASRYTYKARSFLTMWQNFSILFPEFKYVDLSFFVPNPNKDARCAIALFYKREITIQKIEVKSELEKIFIESSKKLFEIKLLDKKSKIIEPKWSIIKKGKAGNRIWKNVLGSDIRDRLDNLLELAGRLAYSVHEGRSNKYAFIAGTEQIWPSIEETISLNFSEDKGPFNNKLFESLCEANYSLFQIDGVAGVYNTKLKSLSKIIRLRNPTKEELRDLCDPINDLDDFYCWTIKKIYETNNYKDCYIIHTQGNGRVLIYGLKRSANISKRESDLLLNWDVRNGTLYEPIKKVVLKKIKIAFGNIDVKDHIKIKKIVTAIRKISSISGEGACLIISKNDSKLRKYLANMELELLRPSWLKAISLDDPQYILKSSFIMDGACLITKSHISTRQAGYPHFKGMPWGIESFIKLRELTGKKEIISKKLTGKGSKTHLSANISTHPKINKEIENPQVVVISISADGPIKLWPQELVEINK